MPSTSKITITSDMIFDLNGRKNKSLSRLIDGDNLTKINDGSSENDFVLPYRSMVVLPAIYGNMKFRVYEYFGSGGTFTVKLYNASKVLLGTYSKAKSAFDTWQENNPATVSSDPLNGLTMEQHTTVRFVEVSLPTVTDLDIGDYEFELYGDVTGSAGSIYPGTTVVPKTDLGKHANGIGDIDDRVQQYLAGSPSTYLIPLMAASVRVGFEGPRFDYYPDSYTGALVDSPLNLGRFGNNHIKTRIFDFTTPRDIHVQFYQNGGNIKNLSLDGTTGPASNSQFLTGAQQNKYIEPGGNADLIDTWDGRAETMYLIAAIYGSNTSADLTGKTILNGTTTAGQGGLRELEIGNEDNRDWAGTTPYQTPLQWYLSLRNVYLRAKQADPNMIIMAPAITFMDTTYWRAVYFWHYWLYNDTFPCDGLNMNIYLSTDLDGQAQSGDTTGLNPEAWGFLTRSQSLKTLFDLIFPNKLLYISENGFASHAGSPYDVPAIGAKTAKQVAADLTMRTKAIAQLVHSLYSKFYYYAFFEDGTAPFDSMGATAMTFSGGGSYTGNTVYPVGYVLANELFVEQNYEWWATLLTNGGTTGAWITRKNHATDPLKKLFKIWRGTMNGSTSAETVPVGPNAISATLYTLDYADFEPTTSAPAIVGEGVDVTATEGMQWLEVTYEEAAGNQDPISAAGADQSIQLPTSQVTVDGGGSSDPGGTIFSYAWSKISGPSTYTITSPSSASTTITGLVEGVYVFRLTVTDNDSATDTDDITITVNPAPVSNRRQWFRGSLRNKFRRG